MKNNIFDSYVKDRLGSYRPDVPSHIWENIAAQSSKRKPLGFWENISGAGKAGLILILFITLGGLTYLLTRKNTAPAFSSEEKNPVSNQVAPTPNTNTGNNNSTAATALAGNTPADFSYEKNNGPTDFADATAVRNSTSSAPGRLGIQVQNALPGSEEELSAERSDLISPLFSSAKFFELLKYGSTFKQDLKIPLLPGAINIPCPEQDAAGNKRYIEVYAGPDYAFRSYSDTANSAYMQQRKASTKLLFAYSAGVRYTKVFGSGMSVRTGINYSQINESFKSEKGQVTQNVYITNTNGDTIGTSTVTGTLYKQSTNKYRSIDIPLTVGYELGNGKLHANVNAGAVVNIHSKKSGFVLDKNGEAVDVSSDKTAAAYKYKTNAGVSITGAVSVYYKLSDKLHVLAEPYVRYSLSPITKPDLTLKEKYNTAGLRLGLRMDLK